MLNRTNRTLSANLNRLNLGTRSLARLQGAFNGTTTLRFRHAHGSTMRVGMDGLIDPSIRPSWSRIGSSIAPGSSPDEPRPVEGEVVRPTVVVPVVPAVPVLGSATAGCLTGGTGGQPQASPQARGVKPVRGAEKAKRTGRGEALGAYRGYAARMTAAASTAAAWG